MDWWVPENPDPRGEEGAAGQRGWVARIKGDVTAGETSSNWPPWRLTSGQ